MRFSFIILISLVLFSCKNEGSKFVDLDLMSKGLPIKIKAPAEAVVTANDMGLMQDITVQKGEKYNLQITASTATSVDQVALLKEHKTTAESGPYFSQIISETKDGFIFEKKIDERVNYDFRVLKIQGDKEYLFQTALIGKFSQEDVQDMFDSVTQ